jgi:O-antigen/teichoic acid export membrane protein
VSRLSGRSARRLSAAIVDQAACSLSTVVLTFATANIATQVEFGSFALVFAVLLLIQNGTRHIVSTGFTLLHAGNPTPSRDTLVHSVSLSLAIGAALTPIGLLVAWLVNDPATSYIIFFASLSLIGLLSQDTLRQMFLSTNRTYSAVASDFTLLASQLVMTWILWNLTTVPTFWIPMAAYGLAAWLAFFVSITPYPRPRPRYALMHAHNGRHLWRSLFSEFLVTSGTRSTMPLIVAALGGLLAAGQYRAGETVAGLLNVAFMGLSMMLAAAFVRRAAERRATAQLLRNYSLFATTLVAVSAAFVVATWGAIWEPLLGASAKGALPISIILMFSIGLNQRVAAILMILRAQGLVGLAAKVRASSAPFLVGFVLVGVIIHGATGGAVGLALGYTLTVALAEFWYRRAF